MAEQRVETAVDLVGPGNAPVAPAKAPTLEEQVAARDAAILKKCADEIAEVLQRNGCAISAKPSTVLVDANGYLYLGGASPVIQLAPKNGKPD